MTHTINLMLDYESGFGIITINCRTWLSFWLLRVMEVLRFFLFDGDLRVCSGDDACFCCHLVRVF